MPNSPEYMPGSAIPRVETPNARESSQSQPEQGGNPEKEAAAFDSLSQAAKHIVEQSGGDVEVVELVHLLGNQLDIIAHYETGDESRPESKKSLLQRALRAAATAAKDEIGRG